VQLKLRYADFTTLTRAHTLARATHLDTEVFAEARALFRKSWKPPSAVRLLGVQALSLETAEGQMDLIEGTRNARWEKAMSAADRLRDKFGESAVSLASGMKGGFRERMHDNPVALRGKKKKK
jgi:DNA polymerase-4